MKKSNLDYTRDITPKRVAGGGAHLRGLAPGLHSSEETSQRWRAVDDAVSDLTSPGMETQTLAPMALCLTTELNNEECDHTIAKQYSFMTEELLT